MDNLIIIAIVVVIVGLATGYIIRAKKQGQKCIGCPYSKECQRNNCTCNNIHIILHFKRRGRMREKKT